MYELKKRKGIQSEFVGTRPSYYEKRIYRASVSQRLRNTALAYAQTQLFYDKENKFELFKNKTTSKVFKMIELLVPEPSAFEIESSDY